MNREREREKVFMLTWNTVTIAQRRESKFFLSGRVSPSLSDPNLQPNRCILRILTHKERGGRGKQTGIRGINVYIRPTH